MFLKRPINFMSRPELYRDLHILCILSLHSSYLDRRPCAVSMCSILSVTGTTLDYPAFCCSGPSDPENVGVIFWKHHRVSNNCVRLLCLRKSGSLETLPSSGCEGNSASHSSSLRSIPPPQFTPDIGYNLSTHLMRTPTAGIRTVQSVGGPKANISPCSKTPFS